MTAASLPTTAGDGPAADPLAAADPNALGGPFAADGPLAALDPVVPAGRPAPDADPLALDQQVCFALVVAARSVVALYRPVLERLGLTHPQYLVMLALWEHAPLSVKRLSELLQLDPGTLSPLLKRLEAASLLTRRRSAADERLLSVELTEQGLELRKLALGVPPAVMQRLGMSVPELQALHASLTRVIAAADPAAAPTGSQP